MLEKPHLLRMKFLLSALVLYLASACDQPVPDRQTSKPQGQVLDARARVLLEQARQSFLESDLEGALRHLDQVEHFQRDLPEVTFLRGQVALKLDDLGGARDAFERVLAQFPEYEAAAHAMGDVAYHSGQYHEALRWYRREDRLSPTPETWQNVGNTYLALEEPDSARTAYERALQLAPAHAPVHYALARLSEDLGQFEEALEHAQMALTIDPDDGDYQYAVGSALLQLGRLEEAEEVLERVVSARPWDHSAQYTLARVWQRLGRGGEAARMMKQADEARAQESRLRATQRAARANRDSPDAQIALAEDYVRSGRFDDAIHAYQVARLLDPTDLMIQQNLASLFLRKGDVHESIARASEVLSKDSTRVPAWVILSAAYARQGDEARSTDAWMRALSIDPEHPAIRRVIERTGP